MTTTPTTCGPAAGGRTGARCRPAPVVLVVTPGACGEVVDAAFRAARERGVPLFAVYVWHDPELPLGGWLRSDRIAGWDAAAERARRELDGALRSIRGVHPDVEVTTVVVDDEPEQFLAALSTRAQLLVVGRPTGTDLPVDALLERVACPVLVLP